jgi:hypothetical protein
MHEAVVEVGGGDVVVAGDDEAGNGRQFGEEVAGGAELLLFGALGEVAGDDDQVRLGRAQGVQQAGNGVRILAAKVEVGDVGEFFYRSSCGCGQSM